MPALAPPRVPDPPDSVAVRCYRRRRRHVLAATLLLSQAAQSAAHTAAEVAATRERQRRREKGRARGCVRGGIHMAIRRARLQSPSPRNVTNTVSVASECGE